MNNLNSDGWNHRAPNAICTSTHPIYGGIIDKSDNGFWFVIPNDDNLFKKIKEDKRFLKGYNSKREAMEGLREALLEIYEEI